ENYVITDGTRILNIYYVQPLRHAEGMAMAFLPAEKILIEANLFDTHEPPPAAPTPAMTTLYHEMRMLNLDVATIAPVHGKAVPMAALIKAMRSAAKDCPSPGT